MRILSGHGTAGTTGTAGTAGTALAAQGWLASCCPPSPPPSLGGRVRRVPQLLPSRYASLFSGPRYKIQSPANWQCGELKRTGSTQVQTGNHSGSTAKHCRTSGVSLLGPPRNAPREGKTKWKAAARKKRQKKVPTPPDPAASSPAQSHRRKGKRNPSPSYLKYTATKSSRNKVCQPSFALWHLQDQKTILYLLVRLNVSISNSMFPI